MVAVGYSGNFYIVESPYNMPPPAAYFTEAHLICQTLEADGTLSGDYYDTNPLGTARWGEQSGDTLCAPGTVLVGGTVRSFSCLNGFTGRCKSPSEIQGLDSNRVSDRAWSNGFGGRDRGTQFCPDGQFVVGLKAGSTDRCLCGLQWQCAERPASGLLITEVVTSDWNADQVTWANQPAEGLPIVSIILDMWSEVPEALAFESISLANAVQGQRSVNETLSLRIKADDVRVRFQTLDTPEGVNDDGEVQPARAPTLQVWYRDCEGTYGGAAQVDVNGVCVAQ
jgi:hypothetical protein